MAATSEAQQPPQSMNSTRYRSDRTGTASHRQQSRSRNYGAVYSGSATPCLPEGQQPTLRGGTRGRSLILSTSAIVCRLTFKTIETQSRAAYPLSVLIAVSSPSPIITKPPSWTQSKSRDKPWSTSHSKSNSGVASGAITSRHQGTTSRVVSEGKAYPPTY